MKSKLLTILLLPLLLVTACSDKNRTDDKTIVVGCSPTPHAEILEAAKPLMKKKGYNLQIKVLQDYVTPNTLLEAEDLDANYFQHVPYLNDFNASHGTDIAWVVKVHFEPMGIYSKKHTSFDVERPTIAIPNDTSNGKRAIALLNKYRLIGNIIEAEAQALPALLEDVDYAVINGNYALSAKITNLNLGSESRSSDVALENANVIAVKNKYAGLEWVRDFKQVMTSEDIAKFIERTYNGAVVPVF